MNSSSPAGPAPAPATAAEGAVGTPSPSFPRTPPAPDPVDGAPPLLPSLLREEDERTRKQQGSLCGQFSRLYKAYTSVLPPRSRRPACLPAVPALTIRRSDITHRYLAQGYFRLLPVAGCTLCVSVVKTRRFYLLALTHVDSPHRQAGRHAGSQTDRQTDPRLRDSLFFGT